MNNTAERLAKWYNIPLEQAQGLVEQAFSDAVAVQKRLDNFYKEGKDFDYVMKELDGFNLDNLKEGTFEIEFNEENFIIEKKENGFFLGVPVLIILPNDECLEPFELEIEIIKGEIK